MLAVSRLNYPGADALNRLHSLAGNDTGVVKVHMDTLTCMTGVTRFMEKRPPVLDDRDGAFWIYDKTEDEQKLLDPLFWEGFDYALAEKPEQVIGRWEIMEIINGFAGVGLAGPEENIKDTIDSKSLRELSQHRKWDRNAIHELQRLVVASWNSGIENPLRRHITRGWWFKMQMEPRIHILRKETAPFSAESFNDQAGENNITPDPL